MTKGELGVSIVAGDGAGKTNCLGQREAARRAAGAVGWMAALAVDAD